MDEPDEKLSQNGKNSIPDGQEESESLNLHNGHHHDNEEIGDNSSLNGHEEIANNVALNGKEETENHSALSGREETGKRGVIKVKKGILSGGSKLASLIDPGSNQATLPAPSTRERSLPHALPDGQSSMMRRTRVNRIILRKRLNERYRHRVTSRLMVVAVVTVIVLFSLLSSGVGAVYAYYRSQLPLLNGIATHSLFQSTHIYDRNGQLLYVLYNHQDGYGRRTYVNYSDIPSVLVNATIAAEDH